MHIIFSFHPFFEKGIIKQAGNILAVGNNQYTLNGTTSKIRRNLNMVN